jgi:triosephosphate isomerase (TIM)
MRYLIANWKMNLPPEGVERYLGAVNKRRGSDVVIVVAPPFPFLMDIHGVRLAAQNCSEHPSGAYTGEVSAQMVQDCGAEMVILGHSERRHLFHETDAIIGRKLDHAIKLGLAPVLCIGEDLKVRDSGQVSRFLADQLKATAVDGLAKVQEIVIAYEPVWAIGTGRNASGQMVAETVVEIRHALERFWPARLAKTPILYGGSVTPDNVADLVENGTIDGFLVGGASLDSSKFLAILAALDGAGDSGKNSHP